MAAAAAASFLSRNCFSPRKWSSQENTRRRRPTPLLTKAQAQQELDLEEPAISPSEEQKQASPPPQGMAAPRVESLPRQPLARSKNLSQDYGGQFLSSTTRHVRIYAAYIDPITHAFDQTQMDKLTLILDPTNEFVWTPDTCQKVYAYFQELVDHYEGAPLSEYTLRLIGSDIEHLIRRMLYDGEIKYNMNASVLNFSMGKPRVKFNSSQIQNISLAMLGMIRKAEWLEKTGMSTNWVCILEVYAYAHDVPGGTKTAATHPIVASSNIILMIEIHRATR